MPAPVDSLAARAAAPAELPALPNADDLRWRPLTPGDVPAWFALVSLLDDADDALDRWTEAELGEMFEPSWSDAARDSVGGFYPDGRLRAFAWSEFRPVDEGTHAPILHGAVHPQHRGRGLGGALLAWSEARARQQLAGARRDLPARISLYVDDHHQDAKALAERAGFTATRWYMGMRRGLTGSPPAADPPAGVRIETYSPGRDDDVRVTHNEAYARDHWGSSPFDAEAWARRVVGNEKFRPDWSFVAVDTSTGGVVGYVLSGAYDQDWAAQGYTEGWTDLLAVRREWRGKGVAAALLTAAMHAYSRGGMEYAGLDVDTGNPTGALGLYTRLGYEPGRSRVLYAKTI